MTIEDAVNVSRLFIPLVAFTGIFIAWQQYQANKEKVRLDLYQRRMDIYRALLEAMEKIVEQDDDYENHIFLSLEKSMDEAYFLLPESVYKK